MNQNFWSQPSEILLSGEGVVPSRVQVLRVGTFYDSRYGTFKITPEILLSLKKNFDAKVLGVDVAIDFAHDNESIAAGWIKSLELTENNSQLWAMVEWTPSGTKVLSSKEFRYLSAEISGDYEQNESRQKFGPTLKGAGLTNRPVIKGMAPVIELQEGKETITMDEKEKEIASLKQQLADTEANLKAKDEKIAEQEKALSEAKQKEEALALEAKNAEKKAGFDKMMSDGKVVEAQREAFMAGDTVKFAELAQPINSASKGSSDNNTAPIVDVQDKIIQLAEAMVSKKEASDLGEAIHKVLSENEELRSEYGKL